MTALDTKALLEGVTPGPWAVGADLCRVHPDWRDEHGNSAKDCYFRNGYVKTIATVTPVDGDWRPVEQSVADARLIASAPRLARRVIELEEALREIVTLTRPLVVQDEDAIWRRAVKIMDLATGLLNEGSSALKGEGDE